tara:strand:- start:155 stop:406 length:252 start_codon:yes stop_codon:yes gene_type:complete
MPRQNFEINKFSFGIVANPEDTRDVPADAASYSLNVDPLHDGNIAGIPDDLVFSGAGFKEDINVGVVKYTQGGGSSDGFGTAY